LHLFGFHDTQKFLKLAEELELVSRKNAQITYEGLHSLSLAITTIAQMTGEVWPAVTIPDFDVHFPQALQTAQAEFIVMSPIVKEATKSLWEAHAIDRQGWISRGRRETGTEITDELIPGIPELIHELPNGTVTTRGNEAVYLPQWQQYPVPKDLSNINLDLLSHPTFHRIFDYMLDTREPVLSELVDMGPLFDLSKSERPKTHPRSFMVLPVAQAFNGDDNNGGNPNDYKSGMITAFLSAVIPWNIFFSNIFHTNGLVYVVVTHSSGDDFTFEVNGAEAIFTGYGDSHDHKYDDLEYSINFEPFSWQGEAQDSSDVNCQYVVYMYPSDDLQTQNTGAKPILLTMAVISVFFLTTLVFMGYDSMVDRRQRVVMTTAEQTSAIVNAMFPAEVRDRLLGNTERRDKKKDRLLPFLTEAPKTRLTTFLNNGDKSAGQEQSPESKPIADLFPNTTVMFADIAGFTAWSSSREPSQVFTLLETVYQAFDNIAKRRRVFKVETIGDCYVAVTGLPEPRKDHAVVMARFARECLQKIDELTKLLEVTLGPGTWLQNKLRVSRLTFHCISSIRVRIVAFRRNCRFDNADWIALGSGHSWSASWCQVSLPALW
jgi:hypothetical protein